MDDFDEIMQLQRQLASRVVQENEMELQVKILDIINSLVKGPQRQVQAAQVFAEAEIEGVSEEQTAKVLKTLEDLNYISRRGSVIKLS